MGRSTVLFVDCDCGQRGGPLWLRPGVSAQVQDCIRRPDRTLQIADEESLLPLLHIPPHAFPAFRIPPGLQQKPSSFLVGAFCGTFFPQTTDLTLKGPIFTEFL